MSLVFGYFIWFMYSQSTVTHVTRVVPVCFYNTAQTVPNAPENITITLQAKRADLYRCDIKGLAVHINGATRTQGTNKIAINEQTLFLPEAVKMVHCKPQPIKVEL